MTMIVGLGGSLARSSTSRAALQRALEGAAAGADTRLLDLRELDLPMYRPDDQAGRSRSRAHRVLLCGRRADLGSPLYQGTVSGA